MDRSRQARDKGAGFPARSFLAAALVALILYLAYLIFEPFFVPLFWGAVLGALFRPLYRRLDSRLGHRGMLSAALLTAGVFFLVLIPALGLAFELVSQAIDLYGQFQTAVGGGVDIYSPHSLVGRYLWPLAEHLGVSREQVAGALSYAIQQIGGFLVRLGPALVGNVVHLMLFVSFTLVALYYTFRDGPYFLRRLIDLSPLPREHSEAIASRLYHVVVAGILSTFVVAVSQAVAAGLVFWALGLPRPLLWAVATLAASMVPVVGAPLTWVPAGLYLLAGGDYVRTAVLALVGTILIMAIDNLLRPLVVSSRVQIHSFYMFFGILGGVYFMGLTGLLLGPVVVALLLEVVRLYEERFGEAPGGADGEPEGDGPETVSWPGRAAE